MAWGSIFAAGFFELLNYIIRPYYFFMDQVLVNRMIRVLYLLGDNLNHTVDEIAEKVETSSRTIYRYLHTFERAGLKIICRYRSVYRLDQDCFNIFKREPRASRKDDGKPERGIILQKPGQNLASPDGTYEMLEQFNENGLMTELPYLQRCVANVDLLVKACGQQRKVRLKNYASNERNRLCERIIEPYDFPFYYNFMWAYDCEMKRNVLLRISRIEEVQILDKYWTSNEQHRRQNMDAWGCYGHLAHPITLRLTLKVKNLMEEAYPMSMLDIKPDTTSKHGRQWILKTRVCNYKGVGRFILGMMDEVEILEGEGLKKWIKERYEALNKTIDRI